MTSFSDEFCAFKREFFPSGSRIFWTEESFSGTFSLGTIFIPISEFNLISFAGSVTTVFFTLEIIFEDESIASSLLISSLDKISFLTTASIVRTYVSLLIGATTSFASAS